MANTLNLTSLPEYIEQNKEQLFVDSTVGAKTLDYVELMLGVKHKEALNYLESEVVLQAAACGWNPNGSDTFAQRYIEVHLVEVEKEFCYIDFKEKYMNYQLRWEAGRETLPFEQKIAESNVEAIKAAVEDMVWQGNSGASVTGFLADIAEASAATVSFASGDTTVEKIDAMVAGLNAKMLKKGVNIFVSMTDFRNYVLESNSTCCANRPILDAAADEIIYAGDSRIKIVPVLGLEDTGKMVAATPDALVYGTDLKDSETVYRIWFDEKEQKFMFRVLFAAGTAVKFPNEVVLGSE
jgi:hypothetical protein